MIQSELLGRALRVHAACVDAHAQTAWFKCGRSSCRSSILLTFTEVQEDGLMRSLSKYRWHFDSCRRKSYCGDFCAFLSRIK